MILSIFFCKVTATPEIYTYLHTLSLHDALPIVRRNQQQQDQQAGAGRTSAGTPPRLAGTGIRKERKHGTSGQTSDAHGAKHRRRLNGVGGLNQKTAVAQTWWGLVEIGRESGRERGWQYGERSVGAVKLKN